MPPRSYMVAAIVLVVLVAVSLPLTFGYSIILWRWLFAAAACVLVVAGAFRVVYALHAPPWIGVVLALPGLLWAADSLFGLMSQRPIPLILTFSVAASLALLAAGAGALRLVETMSTPHPGFAVGYGVLAASALLLGIGLAAYAMGWNFTKGAAYLTSARALGVAAAFVKYGAFIGAAVLITMRHGIEPWAGAAISLISAYMLYSAVRVMLVVELRGDLMFWLQPVLMLVGAAAVWRIGSVLGAQARRVSYAQV